MSAAPEEMQYDAFTSRFAYVSSSSMRLSCRMTYVQDRITHRDVIIYDYSDSSECLPFLQGIMHTAHPYLMPIIAWCVADKSVLLVAEIVGVPLGTKMQKMKYVHREYTEQEVLGVAGMMLAAAAYAELWHLVPTDLSINSVFIDDHHQITLWNLLPPSYSFQTDDSYTTDLTQDTTNLSIDVSHINSTFYQQVTQILRQIQPKNTPFSIRLQEIFEGMKRFGGNLEVFLDDFIEKFPEKAGEIGLFADGCIECKRKTIDFFCTCRSPPVLICKKCKEVHFFRKSTHFFSSCENLETNFGAKSKNDTKMNQFQEIIEELDKSILQILGEIEVSKAIFQQYISKLNEKFEKQLQNLKKLEKLATDLRDYFTKNWEFFVFSDESELLSRLNSIPKPYFSIIYIETGDFSIKESISTLECELNQSLFLFDSNRSGFIRKYLNLEGKDTDFYPISSVEIDSETSFVYFNASKMVVCGGKSDKKRVILLNLVNDSIEISGKFIFDREKSGFIVLKSTLFVFGGRKIGPFAEFFDLNTGKGQKICDMCENLSNFCPCSDEKGEFVYIPGRVVVKYDPGIDEYKRITVLGLYFEVAVAVCVESVLYVFTDAGLLTIDMKHASAIRKSDLHQVTFCSNPTPRFLSQAVYFTRFNEPSVLCFSFANRLIRQFEV